MRDEKELKALGWRVLVIWEHELREDPIGAAFRVKQAQKDFRFVSAGSQHACAHPV